MTTTMPHPNAPTAQVTAPVRYVVVDGWAYWVNGRDLMSAPLDTAGQVSWQHGAPDTGATNEVADIIAERLRTTLTMIDFTHRKG